MTEKAKAISQNTDLKSRIQDLRTENQKLEQELTTKNKYINELLKRQSNPCRGERQVNK